MLSAKNKTLTDRIQRKRNCARSSCRVYASNLRRIHREFSDQPWSTGLKWLQDEAILGKIKKLESTNVKRNLANASAVGLSVIGDDKLKQKYTELLDELRKTKPDRALSSRQKENFVKWSDVIKLKRHYSRLVRLKRLYSKDALTTKDFLNLQRNLVLNLYVSMNPIRLDYANTRIISEKQFQTIKKDGTTNYLVTGKRYKFYFYQYKTSRKHGIITLRPPPKLVSVLKKHSAFLRRRFEEPVWLLYNSRRQRMTRNGLSKFMTTMFVDHYDKKVSASMLRTIFLSHKYKGVDIEEREATAKSMMHTRETQNTYIKKTNGESE